MNIAWLPVALSIGPLLADSGGTPGAPAYTADSIANTAAAVAGLFAPNTFLTIYGSNLSYVTKAMGSGDIQANALPTALTGAGVRVLINQIPANLFYVSPGQVNVLIPSSLIAGPANVQVINDNLAGPAVSIALGSSAPALFQSDPQTVIATHGNGPSVTRAAPAQRGEIVVLYATGLGVTSPPAIPNQIPQSPAPLADLAHFQVLLNGIAVDSHSILYAGVTPGFGGLFQINLQIPANAPSNPEIRVGTANQLSPAGRVLPLQ